MFVLKDAEIVSNISGLKEGKSPYKYPRKRTQNQDEDKPLNKIFNLKFIMSLIAVISIFVFIIYKCESNVSSDAEVGVYISEPLVNDTEGKERYQSPLEQITTWENPEARSWGVWLISFKYLESAEDEKRIFERLRDISIMKLDDGRYHLIIFADTRKRAKKEHSREVKKKWPNSLVIPIDKCKIEWSEDYDYCECK